jgi:hypothetical protein
MAEITTTQSFSDGDTVTATKLNNIQGNASIQPEAITNRSAETTIDQANDLLLIYDASATALKKVTPSDLIKAGTASNFPITGNATIGGTLGVTGNTSLAGTLGVTGASTLTGNTSIGGTLGVSGAITATSTINGTTIPTTKTLVTTVDTQTLTNKTLTTPIISSISNTGTLTLPTATDTIVGRATTDTLTNKTLTSPSISDPTITGQITASTSTINIGSGQIYKDASGNVGVGTNSPQNILHIASSTAVIRLQDTDTVGNGTNNVAAYLGFRDPTASIGYIGFGGSPYYDVWNECASPIRLGTSGVERLRIDSSGNVGIGQSSLTSTLTVNKAGTDTVIQMQEGGTNTAQIESFQSSLYLNVAGANNIIFRPNSTERMRIDSSGRVGIGTTSPLSTLVVNGAEGANTGVQILNTSISATASNGAILRLSTAASPNNANFQIVQQENRAMEFLTNNTERARIDSSGNLLVGKTSLSTSTVGFQFDLANQKIASGANGAATALFNRNGTDGMVVQIAKDGTVQGDIYVNGTTVSYNGGHLARWSQLPSGQRDPAIKKGTVLSNLDAMCEWRDADGNLLPNEQLNKVKISDVEGDSNTAGVFVDWDNDDQDNPYDLNMAMTGDMIIRIAQGTSVNRGDLLMSAGDGTAKPQGDDIIRSKTIAKVTSTNVTCTYEDGSYCVPCVLMAC